MDEKKINIVEVQTGKRLIDGRAVLVLARPELGADKKTAAARKSERLLRLNFNAVMA